MHSTNDSPPLIGLIRVSTGKQAASGLGLDAQRDAITAYATRTGRELIHIYEEIQSGKHDDITDRPVLRSVLARCARERASLVVAKLDRLTRSMDMYVAVRRRGVSVIALDIPSSNEMTTEIMVAVKAEERRAISTRTKDALRSYALHKRPSKRLKALYPEGVPQEILADRAGKLGAQLPECRGHLTAEDRDRGRARAARNEAKKITEAYADLVPRMLEYKAQGLSLRAIAGKLNAEKELTRNKKPWNHVQVGRVIKREESNQEREKRP